MRPNINEAERYLSLLGRDEAVTFKTLDDSNEKRVCLASVFHGSLAQHTAVLKELNQQGAGVYVMVNQGDGVVHDGRKTCRTKDNVVRVRALFVDLDGTCAVCAPANVRWASRSAPVARGPLFRAVLEALDRASIT